MRRFNNMGRGRGRPQADRGQVPGAGPLMTEHLTIRNLDKELDILRRKRESIRRQQEMMNMESHYDRKRQYDNQQSNHNFSGMPSMNVWESSPPKRFNDFQQDDYWREGADLDRPRPFMHKSVDSNYIPPFNAPFNQGMRPSIKPHRPAVHPILKQGGGQRILRTAPNTRKDFNPTKITKNKPLVPNKLKSYPVEERKNLVTKTMSSQGPAANKGPAKPEEDMILREDQLPTPQMTGRLELALGNIVKEIKTSFVENVTFTTLIAGSCHQRTLKQAIRDRIRQAMIGQRVANVVDIVAKYRKKFPKDTDKELVDLVLNAKDPKVEPLVESDDPEEFFKKNISRIIERKLEEMCMNMAKVYMNANRRASFQYVKGTTASKAGEPNEKDTPVSQSESAMKTIKSFGGKEITVEQKRLLNKYYTELIENILEEKIPDAMSKCVKHFTKIFDLDYLYRATKFMAMKRIRDTIKDKKPEDFHSEQNEEGIDEKEVKSDQKEEAMGENQKTNEQEDPKDTSNEKEVKSDQKEEAMGENQKKNKQEDPKDTSMEEDNPESTETPNENPVQPSTPAPAKPKESPVGPKTPKTPSTPAGELPYYVKLFGRPTLPTRAAIHDFLKVYHPTSIKKHKSINNLLVVGFAKEEDYNKIITASETAIGNITIIIKASEKAKDNESTNNGNESQKEEAKENAPEKPNNVLDDQINDLLSTIRKSDEETATTNGSTEGSNNGVVDGNESEKKSLEPVKEVSEDGDSQESEKLDKVPAASAKETGRSTPVRNSSRLANATPSTIRTRRASRLMQE